MNDGTARGTDSILSEFEKILKDFSHLLINRKQSNNTFLPVSEASELIMDTWGQAQTQKKNQTQKAKLSQKENLSQTGDFFFQGPAQATVFIVDSEGSFFSGDVGGLLAKILGAMKLNVEDVFICSPSNLRAVHTKIKEISPKIIITLGEKAGCALLKMNQPLEKFRGTFHDYCGIKVMPTFHPSLLLQKPECKRQVWEDMKQVMVYAGLGHGS